MALSKRIVGLWPYVLIVISLAGLAYLFLAVRVASVILPP